MAAGVGDRGAAGRDLYVFLQRHFIRGMLAGAVKG